MYAHVSMKGRNINTPNTSQEALRSRWLTSWRSRLRPGRTTGRSSHIAWRKWMECSPSKMTFLWKTGVSSLDFLGFSWWIFCDVHGFSLMFMDFLWFSWIFCAVHGFSWIFHFELISKQCHSTCDVGHKAQERWWTTPGGGQGFLCPSLKRTPKRMSTSWEGLKVSACLRRSHLTSVVGPASRNKDVRVRAPVVGPPKPTPGPSSKRRGMDHLIILTKHDATAHATHHTRLTTGKRPVHASTWASGSSMVSSTPRTCPGIGSRRLRLGLRGSSRSKALSMSGSAISSADLVAAEVPVNIW